MQQQLGFQGTACTSTSRACSSVAPRLWSRLGYRRSRQLVSTVQQETVAATSRGKEIVDRVLQLVENTDGGLAMSESAQEEADSLINELEAVGDQQDPRPLDNPQLWGNYAVAAGGRFRGRIGRALFATTGVFQSVLQPGIVTNKVSFRMLGLIPGYIGLRGKVVPVGSGKDTVRVLFDRPVLKIGALCARIGPPSEVELKTTYLDDRVRLGKGSRGSLFVFSRGGAADAAGMDKVGLESTPRAALLKMSGVVIALLLGGLALWTANPHPVARAVAAVALAFAAGLGGVLRNGGIIPEDVSSDSEQQGKSQRRVVPVN